MNKHVSIVHEEKNKLNIRLSDEFARLQTKTTFQARKRYKVSESDLKSDLENTKPPKSKRKKVIEDKIIRNDAHVEPKIVTLIKEKLQEDSTDIENTNHVSKTLYTKPYKCHICPNTYFQYEKQFKQHLEAHFTDNVHTNVETNPKENTQWRPFGYREPKNMKNAPKKQKIMIKEELLDVASDLESNRSKSKLKKNEDQITSGPKNKNSPKENAQPKKQKVMIKEELIEVSSDLENNRLKNKRKTIEDQISNEPTNQNSNKENASPKKQKIVVKEKLDKTELQKLYAALLTDPQNVKKAKEDYFDKLLKNHI